MNYPQTEKLLNDLRALLPKNKLWCYPDIFEITGTIPRTKSNKLHKLLSSAHKDGAVIMLGLRNISINHNAMR